MSPVKLKLVQLENCGLNWTSPECGDAFPYRVMLVFPLGKSADLKAFSRLLVYFFEVFFLFIVKKNVQLCTNNSSTA